MKPNLKHNFSGIYCIKCISNNKIYVGKSINIFKRMREHIYRLNSDNDPDENTYLFNAWKKHGIHNFEYSILENVSNDETLLSERELYWIHHLNSLNRNIGYNLRSDSNSKCIVHQETRDKISIRLKKEWASGIRDTHSVKLRESWKLRDKTKQSECLTNTLTKYKYLVDGEICTYKQLCELKLQNCICTFIRSKKDVINFKGCVIKRVLIEDIVQS